MNNSRRAILWVAVVLIITTVGYVSYGFFVNRHAFNVIFSDAKLLEKGDPVYLNGLSAGRVGKVRLESEGILVTVNMKRNMRDKVTKDAHFFIDADAHSPGQGALLIRQDRSSKGLAVTDGDTLQGVNSMLEWKTIEYAVELRDLVNGPALRRLEEDLTRIQLDIEERLEDLDWQKMDDDFRDKIDSLMEKIDQFINSGETYDGLEYIEANVKELERDLRRSGESEEVEELMRSLDILVERLERSRDEDRGRGQAI